MGAREDRYARIVADTIRRHGSKTPCTILTRVVGDQNDTGGIAETYEARESHPSICYAKDSQQEQSLGGQAQSRGDWRICMAADVIVEATDRLMVKGIVYDVVGTDIGAVPNVMLTCYCVIAPTAE